LKYQRAGTKRARKRLIHEKRHLQLIGAAADSSSSDSDSYSSMSSSSSAGQSSDSDSETSSTSSEDSKESKIGENLDVEEDVMFMESGSMGRRWEGITCSTHQAYHDSHIATLTHE
jgi:hypothetical protein